MFTHTWLVIGTSPSHSWSFTACSADNVLLLAKKDKKAYSPRQLSGNYDIVFILVSEQHNRDCKWCTLWRSTRRSLHSKCHAVFRCTPKCKTIYAHIQSTALPASIFM